MKSNGRIDGQLSTDLTRKRAYSPPILASHSLVYGGSPGLSEVGQRISVAASRTCSATERVCATQQSTGTLVYGRASTPYAAADDAEFFAVLTEYFFERPRLVRGVHD